MSRRLKLRIGATVAFLVIVLVVAAATGYYIGVNNQRTITSISSVTFTKTSTSVSYVTFTTTTISNATFTTTIFEQSALLYSPVSSTGLQLQMRLNASTVRQGGALTAQIYLLNTLPRNLSLTPHYSSNSNISGWNDYDFLCGLNYAYGLAGFALFEGHLTPANISSAGSPLSLVPPVALPCPFLLNPTTVVFLPRSNLVVGYYNESSQSPGLRRAELNVTTESCVNLSGGGNSCGALRPSLFGYWNSSQPYLPPWNATVSSKYFHYFASGQYTLVAQDLWNQTIYAYFRVE